MDVLGTYIDFGPRWVQNLQMVQTDETPVSPGGFDLELQHKSAGMERANKILLDPSRRMSDREIPKGREFRQAGFGLDEGNVLRVVEEGNAGGLSNEELGVLKVKTKAFGEAYADHGPIAEDLDELGPVEGLGRVRIEVENPNSANRH